MSDINVRPPKEEEDTPGPTLAETRPARMGHPASGESYQRPVTSDQEAREKQIPPLRDPTRHNSARRKKSGRSGRDDKFGVCARRRPSLATRHQPLATSVICYAIWRSTPMPRARPAGSHPRKHRKFFMERCIHHENICTPTRRQARLQFQRRAAALPLPVLERVREELLDYRGTGMSVMELSHRSAEYEAINNAAEQNLRRLLAIPEEYAVIFVQGGGSMQFTMAPMNLCLPGKPVDVLHTGAWTAKAIGELKKGVLHNIAASTEAEKFTRLPRREEIKLSPDASYTYICSNNTIEGTQYTELPASAAPLVADMSSDIASRPLDVGKFGLIFAGAQ